MLSKHKQPKDTVSPSNFGEKKPIQNKNSFNKLITNSEKIRKLDKVLRSVAIDNQVQQLTSEIDDSNISQIAVNVDKKHQNKCEEITEKSILELEDRILKKIEILKDKTLEQSKRSELTQTMLQEHILYMKLRRQSNNKINRKSKLEQTSQSKDGEWISKLVRRLGSYQDSFNKKCINIHSIDSSEKQSQSQTKIKNKKSLHFQENTRKQLSFSQAQEQNSHKYKTSTFLNKQSQQVDEQQYQQLQNELKQLTIELQEQNNLLEDIRKQNDENLLKSSRLSNKSYISKNTKSQFKSHLKSRASTTLTYQQNNHYPFLIQRIINTKTYTPLVPGQYITIPHQVQIDIKIIPN